MKRIFFDRIYHKIYQGFSKVSQFSVVILVLRIKGADGELFMLFLLRFSRGVSCDLQESLRELLHHTELYTAISRKVVGKNVHATIPKGNMGYDQYTVPDDCSCGISYLWCFPLALANICPWPQVPFFQISLKKSELKTTHNTFWDCRVHFFRQPFSK